MRSSLRAWRHSGPAPGFEFPLQAAPDQAFLPNGGLCLVHLIPVRESTLGCKIERGKSG